MSENRGCCRKLFWVFAYSATMLRWSENTGPHDQVWVGVCSGDLGQRQADSQRPICKRGLMMISDHTCSLPLVACHTVCDVFTYADWGCSHLHKCPLFSRDCSHSRRWWFPLSFCLFPMILMAWKGSESLKKKKERHLGSKLTEDSWIVQGRRSWARMMPACTQRTKGSATEQPPEGFY